MNDIYKFLVTGCAFLRCVVQSVLLLAVELELRLGVVLWRRRGHLGQEISPLARLNKHHERSGDGARENQHISWMVLEYKNSRVAHTGD